MARGISAENRDINTSTRITQRANTIVFTTFIKQQSRPISDTIYHLQCYRNTVSLVVMLIVIPCLGYLVIYKPMYAVFPPDQLGSGADKRPLPSNAPPKHAATLEHVWQSRRATCWPRLYESLVWRVSGVRGRTVRKPSSEKNT